MRTQRTNPWLRRSAAACAAIAMIAAGTPVQAATKLTLDEYLSQVKSKLPGYRGAQESAAGASERSGEGLLLTTPTFFFNGQWVSDAKLPAIPVFNYEKVNSNSYSLGIAQQTRFGLQGRLSYNIGYLSYVNPTLATGAAAPIAPYHDTRPALELTQSLWNNGFGAGTRAQQEASEAQALAQSNSSGFQAQSTLAQAEGAYWRLALARRSVVISREALSRAQRIEEWSARRARLHLGDLSDALQARAALQLRQLELENAVNEERSASRAFEHFRNDGAAVEPEAVADALEDFDIKRVSIPEARGRAPERMDLKAAEQLERATRANAEAARSRDLPTLELFGSYALNGRKGPFGESLSDPFSAGRPTTAVGVRFSAPLDLGLLKDVRGGWAREQAGAELAYQQKRLDLAFEWKELERRMSEARTRLKLAEELESTQERKLMHERDRFNSGRTTTYQVLVFEQDYAQAQLSRLRAQADVLSLAAQMKLFEFPETSNTQGGSS